jgi:hypothetical protein
MHIAQTNFGYFSFSQKVFTSTIEFLMNKGTSTHVLLTENEYCLSSDSVDTIIRKEIELTKNRL